MGYLYLDLFNLGHTQGENNPFSLISYTPKKCYNGTIYKSNLNVAPAII